MKTNLQIAASHKNLVSFVAILGFVGACSIQGNVPTATGKVNLSGGGTSTITTENGANSPATPPAATPAAATNPAVTPVPVAVPAPLAAVVVPTPTTDASVPVSSSQVTVATPTPPVTNNIAGASIATSTPVPTSITASVVTTASKPAPALTPVVTASVTVQTQTLTPAPIPAPVPTPIPAPIKSISFGDPLGVGDVTNITSATLVGGALYFIGKRMEDGIWVLGRMLPGNGAPGLYPMAWLSGNGITMKGAPDSAFYYSLLSNTGDDLYLYKNGGGFSGQIIKIDLTAMKAKSQVSSECGTGNTGAFQQDGNWTFTNGSIELICSMVDGETLLQKNVTDENGGNLNWPGSSGKDITAFDGTAIYRYDHSSQSLTLFSLTLSKIHTYPMAGANISYADSVAFAVDQADGAWVFRCSGGSCEYRKATIIQ